MFLKHFFIARVMNKNKDNSSMGKKYNIIASFSDGIRLQAAVIALDENTAYNKFMESPEVKNFIVREKKKLQQDLIFDSSVN